MYEVMDKHLEQQMGSDGVLLGIRDGIAL